MRRVSTTCIVFQESAILQSYPRRFPWVSVVFSLGDKRFNIYFKTHHWRGNESIKTWPYVVLKESTISKPPLWVSMLVFGDVYKNNTLTSWWLNQANWKLCSSNWIISPGRCKHKKAWNLKPPGGCISNAGSILGTRIHWKEPNPSTPKTKDAHLEMAGVAHQWQNMLQTHLGSTTSGRNFVTRGWEDWYPDWIYSCFACQKHPQNDLQCPQNHT